MKHCISSEAEWALTDPELQLQTSVSRMEERGRHMNTGRLGRASCSMTSGGAKSLSSALFLSQSHAPYMVRAVVTTVSGFFPIVTMAQCQADIAGLKHAIYILVL